MSNASITYLVAGCAGVFALAAFVGLILVPAWQSYSRAWERVAATFMSLYVLATLVGAGALIGTAVFLYWDRVL